MLQARDLAQVSTEIGTAARILPHCRGREVIKFGASYAQDGLPGPKLAHSRLCTGPSPATRRGTFHESRASADARTAAPRRRKARRDAYSWQRAARRLRLAEG